MNLYPTLLRERFANLPPQVRAFHDPIGVARWVGTAQVRRGRSLLARLTCQLFGFPPEGDAVPLTLTITPENGTERWDRDFGGKVTSSLQRQRDCTLIEHLGPMRIYMKPVLSGDRFSIAPFAWSFLGLPLPRSLMPTSENFETEREGRFCFDVSIAAPLVGPIVTYRGELEREHV